MVSTDGGFCKYQKQRQGITMIKKVVSGGQTGADQAALDIAIKLGVPYGGWIPRGRKTEAGPLPETYKLQEMPDENYASRTRQNVIDSSGTLIISHGELTGGSEYTMELAIANHRPWLHIDMSAAQPGAAAKSIKKWVKSNKISILNVAGSCASRDPEIYQATSEIMEAVLSKTKK
jgi:hypothetical protein